MSRGISSVSSRVEDMKRRFEVSNNGDGSPLAPGRAQHKINGSPLTPGRAQHKINVSPLTPGRAQHKINVSPLAPGRGQHVRRSPAFRCDKMVKGRNVVGQRPRSFTDPPTQPPDPGRAPVKRLHSSPGSRTDPTPTELCDLLSRRGNNDVRKPEISLPKPTATAKRGNTPPRLDRLADSTNDGTNGRPTIVEYSQVVKVGSERRVLCSGEVTARRTKDGEEADQVKHDGAICKASGATATLLNAPLPPGPPPRKPPRTFAHSPHSQAHPNLTSAHPNLTSAHPNLHPNLAFAHPNLTSTHPNVASTHSSPTPSNSHSTAAASALRADNPTSALRANNPTSALRANNPTSVLQTVQRFNAANATLVNGRSPNASNLYGKPGKPAERNNASVASSPRNNNNNTPVANSLRNNLSPERNVASVVSSLRNNLSPERNNAIVASSLRNNLFAERNPTVASSLRNKLSPERNNAIVASSLRNNLSAERNATVAGASRNNNLSPERSSVSVASSLRNNNNNSVASTAATAAGSVATSPPRAGPLRSKTESEIMLRKLERVLWQHGGRVVEPSRPIGCFDCVGHGGEELYRRERENQLEFFVSLPEEERERERGVLRRASSAEHIYAVPYEAVGENRGGRLHAAGPATAALHYLVSPVSLDGSSDPSANQQAPLHPDKIQLLMDQAFAAPQPPEEGAPQSPDPAGAAPDKQGEAELTRLTERRKKYVRRVSCRVVPPTPPDSFPHLFSYVLLVGLNLVAPPGTSKAYVKRKFPANAEVTPHIEDFCFPDADDWPRPPSASANGSADEQSYSLVITNDKGDRTYGYCRRVMPEGMDVCLPLAYCIISPFRATGFYYKVLSELESRHGQPEAVQDGFISDLYNCQLPGPGQSLKPAANSSAQGSPVHLLHTALGPLHSLAPVAPAGRGGALVPGATIVRRPLDLRLEERDLTQLFTALGVSTLLQLFSTLLLERRVLMWGASLSKLSSCVEALQSILYPFSWQHTFIPVLPTSQMEYCDAPTPFVFGVLKGKGGQPPPVDISDGMVVDLETGLVLSCVGDEASILPPKLRRSLKAALQMVTTVTQPGEAARNVLISEAFVRAFVELCGHYRAHIVTHDGQRVFERESFVKAPACRGVQLFLDWFTETSMFHHFLDQRLSLGARHFGVFEQRAVEHGQQSGTPFLRNYKAVNKKFKTIGDRFKDWTPFT